MIDEGWMRFAHSGKVADYLTYCSSRGDAQSTGSSVWRQDERSLQLAGDREEHKAVEVREEDHGK